MRSCATPPVAFLTTWWSSGTSCLKYQMSLFWLCHIHLLEKNWFDKNIHQEHSPGRTTGLLSQMFGFSAENDPVFYSFGFIFLLLVWEMFHVWILNIYEESRQRKWLREAPAQEKHCSNGLCPNSFSTPPPSSKRTLCGSYFRRKSVNFLKQQFRLWKWIFWQLLWSNFVLRWYSDGYHDR